MTAVTIRPARSSDQDAMAAVADATELFPGEALGPMLAGHLAGAADVWLVAEVDGRVVGFAFCEPERFAGGSWNLRAIGIGPAVQGMGAGTALVRRLEALLRDDGQRILVVETTAAPDHAGARAFYLRCGYVEEARIRHFWDVGVDKVVFWKQL